MENKTITLTPPPLGLVPREIHRNQRIAAIKRAIARYEEHELTIPQEWTEELTFLSLY